MTALIGGICLFCVVSATWLGWRAFAPDWMGAFWLSWLVIAVGLAISLPKAAWAEPWPDGKGWAEREAWVRAHPCPGVLAGKRCRSHALIDTLPPCAGLGYSDETPLWVHQDKLAQMVTEQIHLCVLAQRGAIRSVGTRDALCGQLERLVFPLIRQVVCGVM